MGNASKFFKSLFGFKTRWSFIKSQRDKRCHHLAGETSGNNDGGTTGSSNHAKAVAAATATVAEGGTFATAHTEAEVVRMTSGTTAGDGYCVSGEWAAVKIQSYFRAYLARKALRALKALVKLQALVRGHLLRKQAADDLRRLQALVRVQRRACAGWFQIADSPLSTTKVASDNHNYGPPTPEKFESQMMQQPRRRNLFQPDPICYSQCQSLRSLSLNGSCKVNSVTTPFKRSDSEVDEEVSFCTAQNSPPVYFISAKGNSSMRVSPLRPAKSDGSRSCLSGYSDHPNYMAYTESSRAKVRSVSVPRQRSQFEVSNTTKRYSVYGIGLGMHRGSNLRNSFVSKAYPGSGRLDRVGMPVGGIGFREDEYSGSIWI